MAAKEYRSEGITVTFDAGRCIHSEECVHGLPEVFDVGRRPWIQPKNAAPDTVSNVVMRCPTGALQFIRPDHSEEPTPEENKIILAEDGPLFIRGDVEIREFRGAENIDDWRALLTHGTRVALCRCGESKNKPFCDNSHVEANFRHDGSLGEDGMKEDEDANKLLTISPSENGPLLLHGEVEVLDSKGETSYKGSKAALCRCGRSENKPFCDGTHARSGWRED
ncbi:MAG: CDGSH iron-sulfur domain-containing protein [Rubrobacteraceae bacterium]